MRLLKVTSWKSVASSSPSKKSAIPKPMLRCKTLLKPKKSRKATVPTPPSRIARMRILRSSQKCQPSWTRKRKRVRRRADGVDSAGPVRPLRATRCWALVSARAPWARSTLNAWARGCRSDAKRNNRRTSPRTFGALLSVKSARQLIPWWWRPMVGISTWSSTNSPMATTWCLRVCHRRRTTAGLSTLSSLARRRLSSNLVAVMRVTYESTIFLWVDATRKSNLRKASSFLRITHRSSVH